MRLVALDLVRFFAAMSVVIYHYTNTSFGYFSMFSQFGYLGVPIFFIISGYVIALSANNRTALQFAVSRFTRLYPAYWASIAFTIAVVTYLTDISFSLKQIIANLTLLNSYARIPNIDGIYWTLQKELQFYGCVFLLIAFNVFSKIKIWLTLWLVLTILFLLFQQPFFMGWFISPEYSSLFIAGIAFYLIHNNGVTRYNLIVLFISLILSSIYGWRDTTGFMIDPSIIEQSAAVVIIWLSYAMFYLLVIEKIRVKQTNFYLMLGALTYPLYLIHNLAGKALINGPLSTIPKELAILITITIMLVLAYTTHLLIEKRIATPMKIFLIKLVDVKLFKNEKN